MPWLSRVTGGLTALVRRARQDAELDAELQAFLEQAIEAKVRAGQSHEAATHAARQELGSAAAVKDHVRDVGWETTVETTWQDLRQAARTLGRAPAVTAVAVASLAVGFGAHTAVFSLMHALMLRPLAVSAPEQLVELLSVYPGEPRTGFFWWRHYEHFRDHNRSFSDLLAVAPARLRVRGEGVEPETVDGELVSGNFFSALGVRPALGRLLEAGDDRVNATDAASAVLSWSYWTSRWHADPAIVGKVLVVNDVAVTVVGVAPRTFSGLQVGLSPSLWVPSAMEPLSQRPSRRLDGTLAAGLMGRLKPGVTIESALADMRVLDRYRLDDMAGTRQSSASVRGITIDLEPAASGFAALRDRFAAPLKALMAVVTVLLLIACANVASLLVARGAARQHEMATRVSLGAGRVRLVRLALSESLLLAMMGALVGLVLALAAARTLANILTSGREFLRLQQRVEIPVQLDVEVLLFTSAVAVLTAGLFGAAPAWYAATSPPASSLRAHGPAAETRSRRLVGRGLIVAQVALSVVLLGAAGLFVHHLSNLRNQEFGFQRSSLLLVTLDPSERGVPREQLFAPYQHLLGRLEAIPGVRAVTLSAVTPISGAGASRFVKVEGYDEADDARRYVPLNWVGPRYFETFGTALLAGREFAFTDKGGPPVAIVNQAMARRYFAGRSPIGGRLQLVGPSGSGITGAPPDQVYEVVGVVGDAKYLDLRAAPPPTVYLNGFQEPRMFTHHLAVKATAQASAVAGEVRRIVREELKIEPGASVMTMDDLVDASVVTERVVATLSSVFGGVAALLAALGVYGLLAFTVSRRTTEIGVRLALGASRAAIARMVIGSALGLVCAGLAIGVPLALMSRQAASRVVPDLPADSVWPLVVAVMAMVAVTVVAAYLPARRAAGVDPADALRH